MQKKNLETPEENLASRVELLGLGEESLRFRMRVPEEFGDIVVSEPKFIKNVPVHLLLARVYSEESSEESSEENGEKKLVLVTCPIRVTEVFIRMQSKVKIFHSGAQIKEEKLDFTATELDFPALDDQGQKTYLEGTLKNEIEVLMEDISVECEENEDFEILRFEVDRPSESRYDETGYYSRFGFKYFTTKSTTKDLQKVKFYIEPSLEIHDKGLEQYRLFLHAPDVAQEVEVDCAVFTECLKDGAPQADSKLVRVQNISRTFPKDRWGRIINFDPDCDKLRATCIFQKIEQNKLSKTAEEVRTEIAKLRNKNNEFALNVL